MPECLTAEVTYPSDGLTLRGFLARPHDEQPRPAVVVIHEWWGLNDHIKDVTQRFAKEGYVALAPDLYSRVGHKVTKDPDEAAKLMERLQSQHALKDLNAATRYLKTLSCVDPIKIGAVGLGMGGTFALMVASHNSDVKASVSFYGQIPPTDSLKYLLAPILYLHGGQDAWIPSREAQRLAQGLKQFGRPGTVQSYADCPHAFFNDTHPEVYRSNEAKDAWQRTARFLATYLR
ncbi:MAG TPA: hypothetical protein DDX89_01390 [Candidatus Omnitrophica bacterium]|nr:hypothetical protein [Candidatus Omnitrophota bacterium]